MKAAREAAGQRAAAERAAAEEARPEAAADEAAFVAAQVNFEQTQSAARNGAAALKAYQALHQRSPLMQMPRGSQSQRALPLTNLRESGWWVTRHWWVDRS